MATKAILDIEIDRDGAFKKFTDSFKEYSDLLAKTPPAWAKVTSEAKATSLTAHDLSAAMLAQAELAHSLAQSNAASENSVRRQTSAWREIASSARSAASHVMATARALLGWGVIGTAVGGLLGIGGLWGIERLASVAGAGRRSAGGLGISYGENAAFGLNYNRVVDSAGMLGGINQSLTDIGSRVGLYGAGFNEASLRGRDTAQIGADMIPMLKRLADATPDAMLGNVLRARHLDQFIGVEDFQRIKHMSAGELAEYGDQFRKDARNLDLSKSQQRAWQDLEVQFHRAGATIETSLIRGLGALAKPLENLSASVAKTIEAFASNPKVKQWIEDFAASMEKFAAYIGTPKFAADVQELASAVGTLASHILSAIGALSGAFPGIFGTKTGSPSVGGGSLLSPGGHAESNGLGGYWDQYNPDNHDMPAPPAGDARGFGLWQRLQNWWNTPHSDAPINPFAPGYVPPISRMSAERYFGGLEGNFGLPNGVLDATWEAESSRSADLRTSRSGAMGPFQFLAGTARDYGVRNPFDLRQSAAGAARYWQHLLGMFGGDAAKAAAGYNWGEGNVARDVQAYGNQWRQHLPAETAAYVAKILRGIVGNAKTASRVKVDIQLHTAPGHNPVASSSQLVST